MNKELEKLSELVLLELTKEEKEEVSRRLKAIRSLLEDLKNVEVGEEPPFLPSLKLKLREDVPKAFDKDELLRIVPKRKGDYIVGPRTA